MAGMNEFEDDDGCPQCDGEGFYYVCFEEYACIDPEGGCEDCMRRCGVCNPLTDAEKREHMALRQILADALEKQSHK